MVKENKVSKVKASIIIRTFNEGRHLAKLLKMLQDQNYKNWEAIIVDSGSADDTLEIARRFQTRIITIPPEDFSFGRSLNLGCRNATGDYLIFISGHAYPKDKMWLTNMLQPFEDEKIAMVYGRQEGNHLTKLSEDRDLCSNFGDKSKILVEESFGNNANAAIRKSLWERIPFDESLPGLEDIDWAHKVQKKGHYIYYKADAEVIHIHEENYRHIYNRFKREAIAYQAIFPNYYHSFRWAVMLFALLIVRDFFYGLTHGRLLRKIAQSPLYRFFQIKGLYDGQRNVGRLTMELKTELYFPEANKSVLITGPDQHSIQIKERPAIGDKEVLVNVKYVAVCSTDLDILKGKLAYYTSGWAKYPIVPGHEFSGLVAAKGKKVNGLEVGDKIVGECILGCGTCPACQNNNPLGCSERKEVGVLNFNGAYSQYLKMDSRFVHKLMPDALLEKACLIEPLAVSLRGVRKLTSGDHGSHRKVAIIGFGTIGNLCAQLMVLSGYEVDVFDKNNIKTAGIKNPKIKAFSELNGLGQYDYIIEATGKTEALKKVLAESKAGVKILLLGLPYAKMEYNFESLVCFDKTLVGSVGSTREDFIEAIRVYERIDLSALTQCIFSFDDYELAWKKHLKGEVIKAIIKVS
ncbi:MAG: family 2 glycosyl transferase [Candidatus Saganbacteria bacterium]|uniref:Family 2 glycosyl transferase n=1 Tax=Candidatus Saganbacteria bacterium TaxID=2575572 RepID=A0A833L2D4_UNCSA|nr:MAG: family 2 glycosyl transferase [Candidatus Saganbacteria bacterium]